MLAEEPNVARRLGWDLRHRPRELQRFTSMIPPRPLEETPAGGTEARWLTLAKLLAECVWWRDALDRALKGLSPGERETACLDLLSSAWGLVDSRGMVDRRARGRRRARAGAGAHIVQYARDLLERCSNDPSDPHVRTFVPDPIALFVDGLAAMGVAIDARWRPA